MMKRILPTTVILAAMSSAALAHPGNHAFGVVGSLVHLFTEPDHLAMMAGAAAVAVAVWFLRKRFKA